MAIPVILKGDTSATVTLALADGYDFGGCRLIVQFCNAARTFADLIPGGSVSFSFSADETANFPLGTSRVLLSLMNGAGEVRSMPWAKIKVTDSPAEVCDAAIAIDPGTLDIDELPERFTDADVKSRIDAIIHWLGRSVPLLLASACCSVFASSPLTVHTATKGTIYNDAPVVTNVTFDAAALAFASNTYTKAETDAKIVELAPAPGDYANVSNRAMTALQSHQSLAPATNYTDSATNALAASMLSRSEAEAGFTAWAITPAKYGNDDIVLAWKTKSDGFTDDGWVPFPAGNPMNLGRPMGTIGSTNIVWRENEDAFMDIIATRTRLRPTPEMEAAWSAKQDALTIDPDPEPTSDNPVASGGVYNRLTELGLAINGMAQNATNAAEAVVREKISTNNAAFVAAVTNCPVVIAAASAESIGEWGAYGTLGALLAALAAGLANLKSNKADKAELPYEIHAVTVTSGAGALADRAVNTVTLSADATLTLPAAVVVGGVSKVRDLLVDLTVSGTPLPDVDFAAATGETVTFVAEGDSSSAEFPQPDAAGEWLYSVTEVAAGKFAVALKQVSAVTQGGAS